MLPQDRMETVRDDHVYYNSTFYPRDSARASELWFDIAALNETEIIPETGISDRFRVFNVSLCYFIPAFLIDLIIV